jgi:hypothetical protein
MNTVLIVTSDEALRARLVSALSDHAVFAAPSDAEALKTLRLIEIDVVLRGGIGMPRDAQAFVARVREIAPSALSVAIGGSAGRLRDGRLHAAGDVHPGRARHRAPPVDRQAPPDP